MIDLHTNISGIAQASDSWKTATRYRPTLSKPIHLEIADFHAQAQYNIYENCEGRQPRKYSIVEWRIWTDFWNFVCKVSVPNPNSCIVTNTEWNKFVYMYSLNVMMYCQQHWRRYITK